MLVNLPDVLAVDFHGGQSAAEPTAGIDTATESVLSDYPGCVTDDQCLSAEMRLGGSSICSWSAARTSSASESTCIFDIT